MSENVIETTENPTVVERIRRIDRKKIIVVAAIAVATVVTGAVVTNALRNRSDVVDDAPAEIETETVS